MSKVMDEDPPLSPAECNWPWRSTPLMSVQLTVPTAEDPGPMVIHTELVTNFTILAIGTSFIVICNSNKASSLVQTTLLVMLAVHHFAVMSIHMWNMWIWLYLSSETTNASCHIDIHEIQCICLFHQYTNFGGSTLKSCFSFRGSLLNHFERLLVSRKWDFLL
jgi:hypothetical protein